MQFGFGSVPFILIITTIIVKTWEKQDNVCMTRRAVERQSGRKLHNGSPALSRPGLAPCMQPKSYYMHSDGGRRDPVWVFRAGASQNHLGWCWRVREWRSGVKVEKMELSTMCFKSGISKL